MNEPKDPEVHAMKPKKIRRGTEWEKECEKWIAYGIEYRWSEDLMKFLHSVLRRSRQEAVK